MAELVKGAGGADDFAGAVRFEGDGQREEMEKAAQGLAA